MSDLHSDQQRHKYIRRILAMQCRGEIPAGVHSITAIHEETCEVFRGGYCDCDSKIRMHTDELERDSKT